MSESEAETVHDEEESQPNPLDSLNILDLFKDSNTVKKLFECAICLDIMREPVQVRGCGHQYCKGCVGQLLRSERPKCPSCRADVSKEEIFDDYAAARLINQFDVNCPNDGCPWEGILDSLLKDHITECEFKIIKCSNEGCDMHLLKMEQPFHWQGCDFRIVSCEHCSEPYVFKYATEHHGVCDQFPISCLLCAEPNIPREKMADHLEKHCGKTIVDCKFIEFGCDYVCERREMGEHLRQNAAKHLELSMKEITQLKEKIAQNEKEQQAFKRKHEEDVEEIKKRLKWQEMECCIMKISKFSKKLSKAIAAGHDNDPPFVSDRFVSVPDGYKMAVNVYLNGVNRRYRKNISVFVQLLPGERDCLLPWPFRKVICFTLIDQQDNLSDRRSIVHRLTPDDEDEEFDRPWSPGGNEGIGFSKFVSHEVLKSRKYIRKDTLFLTVSVSS